MISDTLEAFTVGREGMGGWLAERVSEREAPE
jgi:hypothetical protein